MPICTIYNIFVYARDDASFAGVRLRHVVCVGDSIYEAYYKMRISCAACLFASVCVTCAQVEKRCATPRPRLLIVMMPFFFAIDLLLSTQVANFNLKCIAVINTNFLRIFWGAITNCRKYSRSRNIKKRVAKRCFPQVTHYAHKNYTKGALSQLDSMRADANFAILELDVALFIPP